MSMVASSSGPANSLSFDRYFDPSIYLCFLAGAAFFAGWDFFAGSGFFCTLAGAFTAVFLLGTLCFTAGLATAAGFATGPRTTLAGTGFEGTDLAGACLAAAALAGTGNVFFPAG
jgi:hypothetical protein